MRAVQTTYERTMNNDTRTGTRGAQHKRSTNITKPQTSTASQRHSHTKSTHQELLWARAVHASPRSTMPRRKAAAGRGHHTTSLVHQPPPSHPSSARSRSRLSWHGPHAATSTTSTAIPCGPHPSPPATRPRKRTQRLAGHDVLRPPTPRPMPHPHPNPKPAPTPMPQNGFAMGPLCLVTPIVGAPPRPRRGACAAVVTPWRGASPRDQTRVGRGQEESFCQGKATEEDKVVIKQREGRTAR